MASAHIEVQCSCPGFKLFWAHIMNKEMKVNTENLDIDIHS